MSNVMMDGVFIVGTGRCGSTLLSRMLNVSPQVLSLSEFFSVLGGPAALGGGFVTGIELWERMSRVRPELRYALDRLDIPELGGVHERDEHPLMLVTLPGILDRAELLLRELEADVVGLPRMQLGEIYSRIFEWLSQKIGADLWIERSGGSLSYVHNLLAMWPHAKFIHIVRDGRECAISMSRHDGFRLWISTVVNGTPSQYSRGDPIDTEKFGYLWTSMIVRRGRLLDRLPQRQLLLLKYEQLLDHPDEELNRVAAFLGMDARKCDWVERAAALAHTVTAKLGTLSAAEQTALQRVCLPGLRQLGYTEGSF